MPEQSENPELAAPCGDQCSLATADARPAVATFSAFDPYTSPVQTCLGVVMRRKWTLIASFAAVFGATCLLTAASPRVYRATATMLVSEPAGRAPGASAGEDQLQVMTAALSAPDIETHATLLQGRSTADATSAWLKEHRGANVDSSSIERAIHASVVPRTHLIRVNAHAGSADDARELANATVQAYAEMNRNRVRGSSENASRYLKEQLAVAKDNLAGAEEALRAFKESTRTVAPDAAAGELLGRAASLRADTDKTRADLAEAEERLREVREQLEKQNKSIGTSRVRDNTVVEQLRAKLVDLEGQRLLFESQYTDAFSAPLDQIDEQIRIAREQLDSEIRSIVRGGGGDLTMQQDLVGQLIEGEAETAALRARERQLQGELDETGRELEKIPARQIRLARLQRQVDVAQGIHSDLLRRAQELEVGRVMALGNTEVVEAAGAPLLPVKPNVPVNLSLGILLGLVVGTGIVLLQGQLDDRVSSEADVARFSEAPVLGAVPVFEGQGPTAALPSLTLRGRAVDAYCSLRVNLSFLTPRTEGHTVLVTSAEPAEGKTTTALNLAIVAAESGRRVILVDADLRGPSIHRLLGTGEAKGLSDVLAGQAALPDVVQRFDGTGLSLIGAGTIPPNPTDLLDSEQMRSLVELLRREADMIVFDSPPLLLAADSLVLASLSDTVLAVCEPGATHGRALRRARMLLNQIGRNISGVVLNKAPQNPDYGYRYGYY
jgi:capsular exopolysaccharide synthesis family protein